MRWMDEALDIQHVKNWAILNPSIEDGSESCVQQLDAFCRSAQGFRRFPALEQFPLVARGLPARVILNPGTQLAGVRRHGDRVSSLRIN
ncbi:hypothetical protein DR64_8132 [Paraburkholderia xenovorans LB400]|nr:hypothetical protein DR64_8132 [Paraburkholderia xenovorans LB400]